MNKAGARAWPFALRDIIAKLSANNEHSNFAVSGINIAEDPPELLGVTFVDHDETVDEAADVFVSDMEIVWRGADGPRMSAVLNAGAAPVRLNLDYLRLTLRVYAHVSAPEGRGNGKPFSFVEGALSPGAAAPPEVAISATSVSDSRASVAAAAATDVVVSAVQAAAEAAVSSLATGWAARFVLSEAPVPAAPSSKEGGADGWQAEARRNGWSPRPLAFLESIAASATAKELRDDMREVAADVRRAAAAHVARAEEAVPAAVREVAEDVRRAAMETASAAAKEFRDAIRRRVTSTEALPSATGE